MHTKLQSTLEDLQQMYLYLSFLMPTQQVCRDHTWGEEGRFNADIHNHNSACYHCVILASICRLLQYNRVEEKQCTFIPSKWILSELIGGNVVTQVQPDTGQTTWMHICPAVHQFKCRWGRIFKIYSWNVQSYFSEGSHNITSAQW